MEVIKIEPEKYKPGVLLDHENNIIHFYGNSFPENAMEFFQPIITWLHEYSSICEEKIKKQNTLRVSFKLTYHNSASHRAFLEIFDIFKKLHEKGLAIHIEWHYEMDDTVMIEAGKDLEEIANLQLRFVEYQ